MTDSSVEFRGQGPFSLGAAQSASAKALIDTVHVTLYVIVDEHKDPQPIILQMVPKVANKLMIEIGEATLSIQLKDGKPPN
jgi:hypothetical protein